MKAAYYNELDPFAAQWLRNLIAAGHIAPGEVDERSILDVSPDDLAGFVQCHFFAGIGAWSLALRRGGWPDSRPVWTGSCPCQPFSAAGEGKGFDDERHLWPFWFHLIEQRHPGVVFGEQVASKDGLSWLDLVHTDMEGTGYAFAAFDLCAAGVGAPHVRQRIFFVADADAHSIGLETHTDESAVRISPVVREVPGRLSEVGSSSIWLGSRPAGARPMAVGNGSATELGRLRAYGNAIVPQVAEQIIASYLECRP